MMDNAVAKSLNFQSAAFALLSYYSLEPDQSPQPLTKGRLLSRWLQTYPEKWVRCALIESLYQGRYKTYCVEQILALWHRRGQPIYHFNHEFEAMICNNVPQRKETLLVVDTAIVDDRLRGQVSQPDREDLQALAALPEPLPQESTEEASEVPADRRHEAQALEPKFAAVESSSDRPWVNALEWPVTDARESVLSSVLSRNQLLPLMFNRIGLVPIHRFMPEAEPVEFCERLAAIARSSKAVMHPESAPAQR
jgi:hypothetical protein